MNKSKVLRCYRVFAKIRYTEENIIGGAAMFSGRYKARGPKPNVPGYSQPPVTSDLILAIQAARIKAGRSVSKEMRAVVANWEKSQEKK